MCWTYRDQVSQGSDERRQVAEDDEDDDHHKRMIDLG